MNVNPFTVRGAPSWLPAWPLQHCEDGTDALGAIEPLQEHEVQQLAQLLSRLLEVVEYEPDLYEALPWLRNVSLWECS